MIAALIMGGVSIILGAFGAHALKKVLTVEQLNSFEVGVRYQMYHALFLMFLATNQTLLIKEKMTIYYLALFGVIFFSGSIYLLSTSAVSGLKWKFLGPITPVGGLLLISSWGYFLYAYIVKNIE